MKMQEEEKPTRKTLKTLQTQPKNAEGKTFLLAAKGCFYRHMVQWPWSEIWRNKSAGDSWKN